MAAYLRLGGNEGVSVRIHDEIVDWLQAAAETWGIGFDLLIGFDPYGDERDLSPTEVDQLEAETSALKQKIEEFNGAQRAIDPELPSTVGEEIGDEPWDGERAWSFAELIRGMANVARTYSVPLSVDGD